MSGSQDPSQPDSRAVSLHRGDNPSELMTPATAAELTSLFKRPSASTFTGNILEDAEFVMAVANTKAFGAPVVPGYEPSDNDIKGAYRKAYSAIQSLQGRGSALEIRKSGNNLMWAFAELFENAALYISPPPPLKPDRESSQQGSAATEPQIIEAKIVSDDGAASSQDKLNHAEQDFRAQKLASYFLFTTSQIQDATAQFPKDNLWQILDQGFFGRFDQSLSESLANLEASSAEIQQGAASNIFQKVNEYARQAVNEQRTSNTPVLFSSILLKRLSNVIATTNRGGIEISDAGTASDLRLSVIRDVGAALGAELKLLEHQGEMPPLFSLIKRTEEDGASFLRHLVTGFLDMNKSRDKIRVHRNERETHTAFVRSGHNIIACGCALNSDFFNVVRSYVLSSDSPETRIEYLEGLKFGIHGNHERGRFVYLQAKKILMIHGSSSVKSSAASVLKSIPDVIIRELSAEYRPGSSADSTALVLKYALAPVAREERLDSELHRELLPVLIGTLEAKGSKLLYDTPDIAGLFAGEAISELDPAKKSALLTQLAEVYVNIATKQQIVRSMQGELHTDDEPVFARAIAAFGANGVEEVLRYAGTSENSSRRVALYSLAGAAARQIEKKAGDENNDASYGQLVTGILLETFLDLTGNRRPSVLGERKPLGGSNRTRRSQRAGSLDDLIDAEGSREFQNSTADHEPLRVKYAAMVGDGFRGCLSVDSVTPDIAMKIHSELPTTNLQSLLTRRFLERKFNIEGEGSDSFLLTQVKLAVTSQRRGQDSSDREVSAIVNALINEIADLGPQGRMKDPITKYLATELIQTAKGKTQIASETAYQNGGPSQTDVLTSSAIKYFIALYKHEELSVADRKEVEAVLFTAAAGWLTCYNPPGSTSLHEGDVATLLKTLAQHSTRDTIVTKSAYIAAKSALRAHDAFVSIRDRYAISAQPLIEAVRRYREILPADAALKRKEKPPLPIMPLMEEVLGKARDRIGLLSRFRRGSGSLHDEVELIEYAPSTLPGEPPLKAIQNLARRGRTLRIQREDL